MAIESKEREINGHVYQVKQLPAMRAMKLLAKLGRIVGPAFAQFSEKMGGSSSGMSVASAMGALLERLTDAEIDACLWEVLYAATIDEAPLTKQRFDQEMSGKMGDVLKLIGFALEVNYEDFFDVIATASRRPLAVEAKPNPESSCPRT